MSDEIDAHEKMLLGAIGQKMLESFVLMGLLRAVGEKPPQGRFGFTLHLASEPWARFTHGALRTSFKEAEKWARSKGHPVPKMVLRRDEEGRVLLLAQDCEEAQP